MNRYGVLLHLAAAAVLAATAGCESTPTKTEAATMKKVDSGTQEKTNIAQKDWGSVPVLETAPCPLNYPGREGGPCEQPTPAPAAAAPTPAPTAAAPANTEPKEKTVVIAELGPPPNKAGECYYKVMLPAEFRNDPVQQVVKPAGERLQYSEPVYQDAEERVIVKPASKKVTIVPAEYGEVAEKVLVREAYRREIEIPALYNTYFEKVLDKPSRDVWKPGRGTIEKVDPSTGEILCLVHEDATYKTVERKELYRAASKRYEDVPAEYATVKKTVLKKPESVQEVEVPAEYQTIKVRKLLKAPEPMKVPVPATYATVNKQVMVHPERAEWEQVLCDVNATPAKIKQVERALNSRGYTVREDGQIDQELTDSIRSFQTQNQLHATGLMTADTLAKLGVELK